MSGHRDVVTALQKALRELLSASEDIYEVHPVDKLRLERAQAEAKRAIALVNQLP